MRKTRRRLEPVSIYDHTGIEKRLYKMAEKGWMLERITPFGWVYRRTEPKNVHFAVTYYANASEFDPEPTEGQQIYQDYAANDGWRFICSSAQMQVFYTEQEDPAPIETDPVIQVENIHRAAKKSFIPVHLMLLGIGILNMGMFVSRMLGHIISLLSSPTNLFTGVCWSMLAIFCIIELTRYYLWHGKAKKAAEHGEFTDTPNCTRMQQIVLVVVLIAFAYWIVNIMSAGSLLMRWVAVLMLVYMAALLLIVNGVKQLLKRKKASRGVNRTVTLVVDFVFAFAMMGAITFGTLRASQNGLFDPDSETYEYRGGTFILHQDDLPLAVEDMLDIDYDGYVRERSADESMFLGVLDVFQNPRMDDENRRNIPWLEYTVVIVKMPFLYDACKTTLLEKYAPSGDVRFPQGYSYVPIDAAPWGAVEAYQLTYEQPMSKYLVCYEDRLLEIGFDWEPTEENMNTVGEKLGGR